MPRWCDMPKETAWMLEHDKGQPRKEIAEAFTHEFGIELKAHQVSLFRQAHGTQAKKQKRGGKPRQPVGYEREVKGYVIVKVKEEATRPGSKDNWKLKHVHVWEQANKRTLPKGWIVLFADRNRRNFDPANLVAIPRQLICVLNGLGVNWQSREELEVCISLARVKCTMRDKEFSAPIVCGVCGATFYAQKDNCNKPPKTCSTCLAQRHKTKPSMRKDVT